MQQIAAGDGTQVSSDGALRRRSEVVVTPGGAVQTVQTRRRYGPGCSSAPNTSVASASVLPGPVKRTGRWSRLRSSCQACRKQVGGDAALVANRVGRAVARWERPGSLA